MNLIDALLEVQGAEVCSRHIPPTGEKYWMVECPYCRIAKLEEDCRRKQAYINKADSECLPCEAMQMEAIDRLQDKLDRYESAVECEGYIVSADLSEPNIDIIGIKLSGKAGTFRPVTIGRPVKVLVMPLSEDDTHVLRDNK